MDSIFIDIIRKIESGKIPVDNSIRSCQIDKSLQDKIKLFQGALERKGFPKISARTILRAWGEIVQDLETTSIDNQVIELRAQLEDAKKTIEMQRKENQRLAMKNSDLAGTISQLQRVAISA